MKSIGPETRMELSYWQSRWRKGNTGFHMNRVYPGLIRHWGSVPSGEKPTVLVPLCGKSLDMAWLSDRCKKVIGIETSEIAVQEFFKEQNLTPVTKNHGKFVIYSAGNIEIWCGDFFHMPDRSTREVNVVYDKAAMVALPARKRPAYREKLDELTGGAAFILLHHFKYDSSEMTGPPFSVPPDEVDREFGARYEIRQLEVNELDISQYEKFRKRGLRSFFIEYLSLLLPEKKS